MLKTRSSMPFFLQSAFLWGSFPILYSFFPVYLNNAGLKESQIGIVMALGPLMSAILQPFIGVRVDRSKSKNAILMLLMGGTAITTLLLPLSTTYQYLLLISLMLACFQSAEISVSETITLEYLEESKGSYGPIRATGTIGYSLVSILLGILMKQDVRSIFYVTAATGLFCMLTLLFIPRIRGHQVEGNRVPVKLLFQNKLLVLYMFFSMMAQLFISFYQTFFPIYFESLGGSSEALGILYFIAAMSELPFLFLADKIIRKIGISLALSLSMGFIALRFLLFFVIRTPGWVYPVVALHGLTFIVFSFSLAVYINQTVKKELRATGQTINGFISMGIGRILGSILGGFAIEALGLRPVMLWAFIICLATIAAFLILNPKQKHGDGSAVS